MGVEAALAAKFQALFPHLAERQRQLAIGAEARSLGHGGIRAVARAAGVRQGTVSRGAAELESGAAPLGRVRREGGGRKRAVELDPGLRPTLLALVEPDMRGDPMSPLRWTTKSTRHLADELTRQGHRIQQAGCSQFREECLVQAGPDASLGPVAQPSPAGYPGAAHNLSRNITPRHSLAQHVEDAG
jgi:hypothetical protein